MNADPIIEFSLWGLSVIGFYLLVLVCLTGFKRIGRLMLYAYNRWLR
jgi:hypothetical protein